MTHNKQPTSIRPKDAAPQQPEQIRAETKPQTPAKPRDDDMPGADGFLSARADEDTYD